MHWVSKGNSHNQKLLSHILHKSVLLDKQFGSCVQISFWGLESKENICDTRSRTISFQILGTRAQDLRRYHQRHDLVLGEIPLNRSYLHQLDSRLTPRQLQFPLHIASTDLRPDIVWWEDNPKKLQLVELTVPFETGFKDAAEELVRRAKQAGYNSHLITIEVPSRGVPHMAGFCRLKQELGLTRTELSSLLSRVSHKAIEGSFGIWCSRNKMT